MSFLLFGARLRRGRRISITIHKYTNTKNTKNTNTQNVLFGFPKLVGRLRRGPDFHHNRTTQGCLTKNYGSMSFAL